MAKIAVEDGISGNVCTPHVSTVFPDNNRERVMECVEQLRAGLHEEAIALVIYPGSELAMDSDLNVAYPAAPIEKIEKLSILGRIFAFMSKTRSFHPRDCLTASTTAEASSTVKPW